MINATERYVTNFSDYRAAFGTPDGDFWHYRGPVPCSHTSYAEMDGRLIALIRQPYPDEWEPALRQFLSHPEMRT